MTDMKGLTCHIAFDLLSLEEDKRRGKCRVIQVTLPQTHISAHRGMGRWMAYNKNPRPSGHSVHVKKKQQTSKLNIFMEIIVDGDARSESKQKDFHECLCFCCRGHVSPWTSRGAWVVPGGGRCDGRQSLTACYLLCEFSQTHLHS